MKPLRLRFAARLARREVVRRPGRTVLVALLVALPVAAMTLAAVFVRTEHMTDEELWRLDRGRADAWLQGSAADAPPGSRVVSYHAQDWRQVRTADGARARVELTDVPLGDPLLEGTMLVHAGRLPSAAGEVFLTADVAAKLHAAVRDELRLERPVATTVKVVGIGDRRAYQHGRAFVVGPGTAVPFTAPADGADPLNRLVDLPDGVTVAQVKAWVAAVSEAGGAVTLAPRLEARVFPGHQPSADGSTQGVRWSWLLGAVVFTVVGIVIASAFASSARRQLTTLGQLSANGAGPAVLRRVLFLQGTWTGVVGAAAGLALGVVGLAVLAPHRYRFFGRDVGPWDIRGLDLLPVFLIGVAAATVAALVPARTTSRTPVLAALAGRRPLGNVPRWLTVAGVATLLGGLALLGLAVLGSTGAGPRGRDVWLLTGIAGGVAVLLGGCAVAPGYVSLLEPLATRLRGPWRLAARSLARQRTRTWPTALLPMPIGWTGARGGPWPRWAPSSSAGPTAGPRSRWCRFRPWRSRSRC